MRNYIEGAWRKEKGTHHAQIPSKNINNYIEGARRIRREEPRSNPK